ncbi:MAG: hypothetical protein JOZ19_12290 [Rubrobacter sp.]|nr:hypothetical protein [Rubrobacter sp.]
MSPKEPDWEKLEKMGLELDEYRRHRVTEAIKNLHNSAPIGWRPFLEHYIEGRQGLHVHLVHSGTTSNGRSGAPYLCATFERPRSPLLVDAELEFWNSRIRECVDDILEAEVADSEGQVAVLVDVPEFIQDRKRLFGRILPVVKRLQPLEFCAQSWPNSPDAIWWLGSPRDTSTRGVSLARVECVDREADLPPPVSERNHGGRNVPVGKGESPDELVERGAEVVDNVTNNQAPFPCGWLPEGFGVNDYLSCLRIERGVNFAQLFLEPLIDPVVQSFQVHFRPLQFQEGVL